MKIEEILIKKVSMKSYEEEFDPEYLFNKIDSNKFVNENGDEWNVKINF
jgi:hypothetical protein